MLYSVTKGFEYSAIVAKNIRLNVGLKIYKNISKIIQQKPNSLVSTWAANIADGGLL